MKRVRITPRGNQTVETVCSRCPHQGPWDRLAGKPICPDCQEGLALGEGQALVERAEKKLCAICSRLGTLCYRTLPLRANTLIELDLCAEHFRDLIGRRLGPYAFQQVRRQLQTLNVDVAQLFLLHDAFYDGHGRALQPACAVE